MNGKNVGIVIVLLLASCMTESCTGQVNITDKTNCSLVPMDPHTISRIKELIKDKNRIIKIELEIEGETGPLEENVTNINQILNPREWFILTEEVSEVMLQFPADYMEKSLYTFSFHQASLQMSVFQRPENCFGDCLLEEILNTIRYNFLQNFTLGNEESTEFLKICNRLINLSSDNKTGEIKYICCDIKTNDCTILVPGIWNKIFNICLLCSKYFLMATWPLFMSKRFFRTFNTTFCCRLDEEGDFVINLNKKDENETFDNEKYKKMSGGGNSFSKLKRFVSNLPVGTHFLKIKSVDITVHEENVLMENVYPVSFTNFLFRNLVLCKRCNSDDEDDDEDDDEYNKCKWLALTCAKSIMFLLMFCVIISPWWATVVFYMLVNFPYYKYLDELGNLLNTTLVKDVRGPSSLNTDYACIALFFVLFCLFNKNGKCRASIDFVLNWCLNEKYEFKKAFWNLIHKISSKIELQPLCIFEFLLSPIRIGELVFYVIAFLFQTIPLLVLAVNILTLSDDNQCELRDYLMLLFCCCEMALLCYSIVAGFISFYIDCIFFTVLGILINYDEVFQYVCLIILFIGYVFNSVHSVRTVYLNFSRQLCKVLQMVLNLSKFHENETQTKGNSKSKTYLKNSSRNILNTAHIVPISCNKQENEDSVFYLSNDEDGCKLIWRVSRLLVFIEETSTCISRRFFDEMSKIKHAAAPGSLSALYAKSFRDLIFVVVFFIFIVFVVFALGKAHDISASVQTLLAVGGGVVPFFLQKVYKSRNKDIWPLTNDVWETIVMSKIEAFEETWEPIDIDVSTLVGIFPSEIEILAKNIKGETELFFEVEKERLKIEQIAQEHANRMLRRLKTIFPSTSSESNQEAKQESVEINVHAQHVDVSFETNELANDNIPLQSNQVSNQDIELDSTNAAYQEIEIEDKNEAQI